METHRRLINGLLVVLLACVCLSGCTEPKASTCNCNVFQTSVSALGRTTYVYFGVTHFDVYNKDCLYELLAEAKMHRENYKNTYDQYFSKKDFDDLYFVYTDFDLDAFVNDKVSEKGVYTQEDLKVLATLTGGRNRNSVFEAAPFHFKTVIK